MNKSSTWKRFHAEAAGVGAVSWYTLNTLEHCKTLKRRVAATAASLAQTNRHRTKLYNYLDGDDSLPVGAICILTSIRVHNNNAPCGYSAVILVADWPAHSATDNELVSCRMVVKLPIFLYTWAFHTALYTLVSGTLFNQIPCVSNSCFFDSVEMDKQMIRV